MATIGVRISLGAQRDDLEDMRAAVLQFGGQITNMAAGVSKALAQITREKEELEQQNALLKTSLTNREGVKDSAIREAVSAKEAEVSRLKGEIDRLRAAVSAQRSSETERSNELSELQRQLFEAKTEAR
eukprot:scaffold142222_cov31-Prasinocladus_malaysianus.AAC.3